MPVGVHGVTLDEYYQFWDSLPSNYLTLAEILKNDGYETALFYFEGNTGFYSSTYGLDRGYNYIESDFHSINYNQLKGGFDDIYGRDNQDKYILDKALSWLNKNTLLDKPIFATIHLAAGHDPYERPYPESSFFISKEELFSLQRFIKENIGDVTTTPLINPGYSYLNRYPLIKKYLLSQYDAALFNTDHKISLFFDSFKKREDTIFIIISDHGEGFLEHKESYRHGDQNAPYLENSRVPTIFFGKMIPKGQQISDIPFSSIDLMPTILGLAKVNIPKWILGMNLSNRIIKRKNSSENQEKRIVFYESKNSFKSWGGYCNGFTYITTLNSLDLFYLGKNYSFAPEGLFNFALDPEEKQNKIFLYPDIGRNLRNKLEKELLWKRRGWNVIIQVDGSLSNYKIDIKTKGLKADSKALNSNLSIHYFSEKNAFDIKTASFNSYIKTIDRRIELINENNSYYFETFYFFKSLEQDQSYIYAANIYSPNKAIVKLELFNDKDEIISAIESNVNGNLSTIIWNRLFTLDSVLWDQIKDCHNWKLVIKSSQKGTMVENVLFSPSNDWIKKIAIKENRILSLDFTLSDGFMVLNFRTNKLNDLPIFNFEIDGDRGQDKKVFIGQTMRNSLSNNIEDYCYDDIKNDFQFFNNNNKNNKRIFIYNIIDARLGKPLKNYDNKLKNEVIEALRGLGYIR